MALRLFVKIVPASVRADAELLQVTGQEEEEKCNKGGLFVTGSMDV